MTDTIRYQDGPFEAPSVDELANGLDRLVTLLVHYRLNARDIDPRLPEREMRLTSGAALIGTAPEILSARDWVDGPVARSLKYGMKKIGELIYAESGIDGLSTVAEEVCERDSDNYGRRMSAINSAFNGIGNEWWA